MELLQRFSGVIPPHNVNDVRKIVRIIVRDLGVTEMHEDINFFNVEDPEHKGNPRFSPDEAKLLTFLNIQCQGVMYVKNASYKSLIESETLEAIGGAK